MIIRKGANPFVPVPDTIIMAGDQIIAVTTPELEEALRAALRGG
jgi:Trk K+ transport system NAD-binding subunit